MEKQIIKNLYSEKDLSEENLKEFQQKKLSAQQKADDLHKEFVTTQQELFDVGLFENEHFTIKGTQKVFDKEVELDMFQEDDNGLYTRYEFKTKFPSFDSRIEFIQLQIVDSKYDENRVPVKPNINKDKLYTEIYTEKKTLRAEMQSRQGGKDRRQWTPEQRAEMLKKFDKDGDGKLSDDERNAAREAMKASRSKGEQRQEKKK